VLTFGTKPGDIESILAGPTAAAAAAAVAAAAAALGAASGEAPSRSQLQQPMARKRGS
jgi:hypothetical protein